MNLGGGFSGVGGSDFSIQFPSPFGCRLPRLLRLLECQRKENVITESRFENALVYIRISKFVISFVIVTKKYYFIGFGNTFDQNYLYFCHKCELCAKSFKNKSVKNAY